jgi:hypothetical protein
VTAERSLGGPQTPPLLYRGGFWTGTIIAVTRIVLSHLEVSVLWTIAVVLVILWALGLVTANTMGGFIHLLLIAAVVTVLIRVIQGRNPV